MAAHKVANALAAGCPTIVKPSELAPYGTQLLAATVDAALPAGPRRRCSSSCTATPGVGAPLVGDPRVRAVSFTGGLAGGRAVAAALRLRHQARRSWSSAATTRSSSCPTPTPTPPPAPRSTC